MVKDQLFPVPPLFKLIHEQSQTAWKEMYQVFNMGHRFEIYTDQATAEGIIRIAGEFKLDAQVVGHGEEATEKKLTIRSEFGEFAY